MKKVDYIQTDYTVSQKRVPP